MCNLLILSRDGRGFPTSREGRDAIGGHSRQARLFEEEFFSSFF
jgi:hypothetical protein